MASESTSSQRSQQLPPSSNVKFRCKEGIIAFNNVVALLEHPNELYRPMLTESTICKDDVPLPPKETVRAGLATLGLFDKDKQTLSSTILVNSSPLKMKYFTPIWKLLMQYIVKCLGEMQRSHDQMNLNQQKITYCLIWGLEIDIGAIIFLDLIHKLQNGKKNRETNICYTRFFSLIFEKLLGVNYISNDLTLVKPHTITAASFQKPLASKVPLTSHMLKVAKLSEEPEQSLIPPSGEVNADDTGDKSLSMASVQPVTLPKAPTDLKAKKKRISPSSKPKSLYKVRVILPKKQVTKTQHAEVTVATADATKSLVASELPEEQVNQPSAVEAEKFMLVLDQNVEEDVKDAGFVAIKEVTFEQIMDEVDSETQDAQEIAESPSDTESKIKIIKSYQATTISGLLFTHQSSSYDQENQEEIDITAKDVEEGDASESLSGLRFMLDDDLASMTGFETQGSVDHVSEEGTETLHASADKPAQSDPLGHLHEELCLIHNKLPGLLSDALKNTLPRLIKDSIKSSVLESIAEELP
ncbi:hypothetical protein Tco_0386901 [Tanacetum coccineum]